MPRSVAIPCARTRGAAASSAGDRPVRRVTDRTCGRCAARFTPRAGRPIRPRPSRLVASTLPPCGRVWRVTEILQLALPLPGAGGRDTAGRDPFVGRPALPVRRLAAGAVESPTVVEPHGRRRGGLPASGVHHIAGSELSHGVPSVLAGRVTAAPTARRSAWSACRDEPDCRSRPGRRRSPVRAMPSRSVEIGARVSRLARPRRRAAGATRPPRDRGDRRGRCAGRPGARARPGPRA